MEPKVLAVRLGISPKKVRAILREKSEKYRLPDRAKGARWDIPEDIANKVEEDYKAKKIKALKTAKRSYTVVIERDPESGWLVGEVVELPGCYTQAPDLPSLDSNIREAVAVYLETVSSA